MPQKCHKNLSRLVSAFRRGILNGQSSDSMCFAVAAPLEGYLRSIGYDVELVEGDFDTVNHFWLRLPGGTIIDPTADQFKRPSGTRMPAVYIGPKPFWYKEYSNP